MKFSTRNLIVVTCVMSGILLAGDCIAQSKSKDRKSSYKTYRDRSSTTNASTLLEEAEDLKVNLGVPALEKLDGI